MVWRRLLRVPWAARKSSQSILKEISPEYSLEGWMLKLKPQYFGHLMKRPWCWERLKFGGERDDRGWYDWMASPTQLTWVWVNFGSWWWTRRLCGAAVYGVTKSWTWLSDWTDLNWLRTSDTMLNKSDENGHPSLIPDLRGKVCYIICGL